MFADVRVRFAESASVSPYVSLSHRLRRRRPSSRGNESRSFVFSMPLSLRGADDTSRPNTKNATPNRTAAPRWIRRRRRVDRGMVGPKRAEFAEGCRRFGRRATGEERRFRLFLFFLGFEIRQVMIYI